MITIVADSSACLTREDARALGAVLVPMSYSLMGRQVYTETFAGENGLFMELIRKNPTGQRTSQASMSAFLSTFEDLRAAGHEVLCLTMSSRLSGTYGNACVAARELGGDGIQVVDSLTTGGALHLMVRHARALIESGMGLAEAAQAIRERRERFKVAFSVDDMGPLRRSGRLGMVRLSVGTILNIKPLLKCEEGGVVSFGVARGRHEQLRALEAAVPPTAKRLLVQHMGVESLTQSLIVRLERRGVPLLARELGPVLGIHLGDGCVGISWEE